MPLTSELQAGRAKVREAGGRLGGPPPYGWRAHRGQLIPLADEQGPRWLILHLRARGWSLQRISDALLGLGIEPRSGGRWTRSAIHRIANSDAPNIVAPVGLQLDLTDTTDTG